MSGAEVLPGGGIDSAVLMPPPSPPPPARNNVSEMNPDALGGFASQAARELEMKKEQLKLAMLELDLAERRERIANQQAERALKIKERELELAEREAKQRALLNPPAAAPARPEGRPRPPGVRLHDGGHPARQGPGQDGVHEGLQRDRSQRRGSTGIPG